MFMWTTLLYYSLEAYGIDGLEKVVQDDSHR